MSTIVNILAVIGALSVAATVLVGVYLVLLARREQ